MQIIIDVALLNEAISGLIAYGGAATEDTVEKLRKLKFHMEMNNVKLCDCEYCGHTKFAGHICHFCGQD